MSPKNSGTDHEPPRRLEPRLVAVFLLALALLNPITISVFDRGYSATVFGIPFLYFYLFAAWTSVVGLLALAIEGEPSSGDLPSPPESGEPTGL